MRSFFTLTLGILAIVLAFATVRQTTGESVRKWFGDRLLKRSELVARFDLAKVTRIEISTGEGKSFTANKSQIGWEFTPQEGAVPDRVDAQRLREFIKFSLASTIIDHIPRKGIELQNYGLGKQRVRMTFYDEENKKITDYSLGSKTAWKMKITKSEKLMDTIYLRFADKSKNDFVYVVTDPYNVSSVIKDDFDKLRDHKPLFFSPALLEEIQIEAGDSLVTLTRISQDHAWQITKPLALRTDQQAIKNLLTGLSNLTASSLETSTATTEALTSEGETRITIKSFGIDAEQTLTLYPSTESAVIQKATVSDRNVSFNLPVADVSVLPLTIDSLRYKFISAIEPKALKAISIDGNRSADILMSRATPRNAWSMNIGSDEIPVDAAVRDRFFSTLRATPVVGFASDTAPTKYDPKNPIFAVYGLDKPAFTATLLGFDGSGVAVRFGQGEDEKYYAHRSGQSQIFEISPEAYIGLPRFIHNWRDKRLWSFSRVDLKELVLQKRDTAPLALTYNFLTEAWTAQLGQEDVFPRLKIATANRYLRNLEKLRVQRWLPKDNMTAVNALKSPVFRLSLRAFNPQRERDEQVTLTIAPASQGKQNRFYYGVLTGEPNLFLLDLKSVQDLAVPLIGR